MVTRSSLSRDRQLAQFGEHIRAWRQLQGLSASELARRANVTRATLRSVEDGVGSPRFDSVMAVVAALGFAEHLVASADPLGTDAGRALAYRMASGSS
ncbi:helix-turn-helix domain-containing protein [Leucobacter albus]|uniref:Helix-turn-helix domain-containing protein n=1 Tax=Leucobacter albus TaxID=272210 RepID=A0ABW3TJX3_9MICO